MYVNPIPVQPPQEPTAPATTVDYSWYLLPSDYFLDMTDTANGQPTGRLLPSLRAAAQTRDGNQILTQVAGLYADIYSDNNQDFAPTPYLTAMTQLAVTGANAFANCPSFPQTALEEFFSNQPLVQASVATAIINQMSEDYNNAVQTVRSPLAGVNHQDREALGWVAVSGEDDPPDFPVNVRIASYPRPRRVCVMRRDALGAGFTRIRRGPGCAGRRDRSSGGRRRCWRILRGGMRP